jgi:hypothetical protein
MALDQSVQSKRRGAGADLVGERRQAGVDSFAGAPIALPIERLMLSTQLKQTSGSDAVVPSDPASSRLVGHNMVTRRQE